MANIAVAQPAVTIPVSCRNWRRVKWLVFTMLIVGVSRKLVPVFTLSEVRSQRRAVVSMALLNAGLLGAATGMMVAFGRFATTPANLDLDQSRVRKPGRSSKQ